MGCKTKCTQSLYKCDGYLIIATDVGRWRGRGPNWSLGLLHGINEDLLFPQDFSTSIQINSPDCAKFHQRQLPEKMTQRCAHHKNTLISSYTVQGSTLRFFSTVMSVNCPECGSRCPGPLGSPYCRDLRCLIKLLGAVIFV